MITPAPAAATPELIIDDRLATVLATFVAGPGAARIQYRQLIDLLGRMPGPFPLPGAALARLDALDVTLPASERAAIVRGAGDSLRHPALLHRLAGQDNLVAAAAIAAARLEDWQWAALIAKLPLAARGMLRHRRDLGPRARRLLARLGIGDLGLPGPEAAQSEAAGGEGQVVEATAAPPPARPPGPEESQGIGAIVRRIEAFRRSRQSGTRQFGPARDPGADEDPRLPLADAAASGPPPRVAAIRFASDPRGRIVWADPALAPMLVELPLGARDPLAAARSDAETARAVREHRPVLGGRIEIDGAPAVAGAWRIDAAPRFETEGGRFLGYRGILRRPGSPAAAAAPDSDADRLRQLLHELRTPINAIQGFAELIQQQLFGPAPHQYRSLAAGIAADSAAVLAGFEEIERLVRFQSGSAEDAVGRCDLAALIHRLVDQLRPATEPRDVAFSFDAAGPAPVAMAENAAERMVWRLLATLAAHAAPGEKIAIELGARPLGIELALALPAPLAGRDDAALFAVAPAPGDGASSLGLLGGGFALRLARAEARAVGGAMERDRDRLILRLPGLTPSASGLTGSADANSPAGEPSADGGAAGS